MYFQKIVKQVIKTFSKHSYAFCTDFHCQSCGLFREIKLIIYGIDRAKKVRQKAKVVICIMQTLVSDRDTDNKFTRIVNHFFILHKLTVKNVPVNIVKNFH